MKYFIIRLTAGLLSFNTAFSQLPTNEQINFLKKYGKAIYKDSLDKQPKLSSLLPHVKGKKLILIGESNHGSTEIFELRNLLIKYLHQETGARTILFESGIGELITADMERANISPSEMTNGLFGGWRTNEFVDLFAYVQSQGISIAGFDIQRTGGSFNTVLRRVVQAYKLDTLTTYNLESRFGLATRELTNRKAIYDTLKISTGKLILDYQKVKSQLSTKITSGAPKDLLLVNVTIENRINYLSYMLQFLKDRDWSKRFAARDRAMANNVEWLVDNVYKDYPVIIIGHNFHIGKYNKNETVMGEILKTRYNGDMYSIGVIAGSGCYADNSGKEIKMTPPDSIGLDIKHIITNLYEAAFLDVPNKLIKGSEWLNEDITINDTFIDLKNTNKVVLSKTFDGLILLKKVSPTNVN
jgi:erythromycin esterase